VPWLFALSLKFEIRTLPASSFPVLLVTREMPYGLMSPFAGTVEATVWTRISDARNGLASAADDEAAPAPADALVDLVTLELELEPEPPHPASANTAAAESTVNGGLGTMVAPF